MIRYYASLAALALLFSACGNRPSNKSGSGGSKAASADQGANGSTGGSSVGGKDGAAGEEALPREPTIVDNYKAPREQKATEAFNLAAYVKSIPSLSAAHDNVAEGNAYFFMGDAGKVRVETNLQLDMNAIDPEPSKPRAITLQYWMDGYTFNQKLGLEGAPRGFITDIGASANVDKSRVEVHIRFLGVDLINKALEAAIDQRFTRDLPLEAQYPIVPGINLRVGTSVGGEIGGRIQAGLRRDNAMQLSFVPKVNLNAKVYGGVLLVGLVKGQAEGVMKLFEIAVGSSANMGVRLDDGFVYGNVGIDGAVMTGLDGILQLVVGAGWEGFLPLGIDKLIVQEALESQGFRVFPNLELRHPIWDPAPEFVSDVPGYGKTFMNFYKQPTDQADCEKKRDSILAFMDKNITDMTIWADAIQKNIDKPALPGAPKDIPLLKIDKKLVVSAVNSMTDIRQRISTYCNVGS